jgi:hypothetical protein
MNLRAFAEELLDTAELRPLVKVAGILRPRPERLVERMTAAGALTGGTMHGLQKAKAGISNNPYDEPEGTTGQALLRGGEAGLAAALLLKGIGRFHKR